MAQHTGGRFGVLAIVLASLLWGTTGTAASLLPNSVSPLAVGACTFAIGGLALFAFSVRASLAALRDTRARRWLVVGAAAVIVYPLAFYWAMDEAGVAIGNVVALGSGPIFAALLEWMLQGQRPSRRWALCAGIAVVGVALLSTGRLTGESSNIPLGVGLGLLAGLAYALYTYTSTRALAFEHGGRGVMGATFGLAAVVLLPLLIATGAPLLASGQSMGIALYLAIAPMFLAYLLFGFGLRSIRSSVATTVTLIEPVVAATLAILVVGERLRPSGWLGLALILLGVTLLVSARQQSKLSSAA